MKKDTGISEVLGSILMIAVFVLAFGIVAVNYLSQPLPEKNPEVSFELKLGADNTINLIHAGGDSLKTYDSGGHNASSSAEYYILIDGKEKWPINDAQYPVIKGEQQFFYRDNFESDTNPEYLQPGEGFTVQPLSLPKNIDVIYKSPEGAETILWSGLIPRIIDFDTGGGSSSSGSGSVGVNGAIRVCVDDTVSFYDTSLGNIIYSDWDFDANVNPGVDSYELNPTWNYPDTGLYTVIHNIGTDDGLNFTLTKQNYIEVKHVHADFTESWNSDCESGDNSCTYCKDNYPGRPCGREPFHVDFTDTSFCNPTGWSWDLGAGPVSTEQDPSYDYVYDYGTGDNTTPTLYTVSLTVSNPGGSDTLTKPDRIVVLPNCFIPVADFSYDGLVDLDGNMAVEFTDLSTGYPDEITSWDWDFGDGSLHSYEQIPPVHEYNAGQYYVKLTVENDCGNSNTTSRLISFPCNTLTAQMSAAPQTGPSPLTVTFTDGSTPHENITAWRWSFGDGTYYYTTKDAYVNSISHTYNRVGTFHASLIAQNNCGQAFVSTSVVVASKAASIQGTVWNDRNEDGLYSSGETGLSGWQIDLEERTDGGWTVVDTTSTNATGGYVFNLTGVSNSVFRVRETLPDADTWRTTYSYGTFKDQVSDNLLIYDKRDYTDIDFGNNDLHTSKISVPGKFTCYGGGWMDGVFYYSSLSRDAEFLDYNTSYNTNPRVVFMQPSSTTGSFTPDPAGGYPNGYTSWGDSSFILTFREYNNYLKRVAVGAYYLDWWEYPVGTNYYKGKDFPVQDNTVITANQLKLTYKFDSSIHFDIDKPRNGDIIPYTPSYIVEAHFEGKGEQTSKCYLTTPVSGKLFYNSTVGEYLITNIDTRPYEGKKKLFTADMTLANYTHTYAYSTASIAFEETTASITGITSDPGITWPSYVKGNATVTASVNGKWQVNTSSVLYVDGKPVTTMTVTTPGLPSTLQGTFDVEPYAGRTVPVFVRIPYNPTHTDEIGSVRDVMGEYEDSPSVNITVLSKMPIHADFNAYPWSGRAPHEVAFTDLSTGGANQWVWDFDDGETSTVQNPIHVFHGIGNYTVSLTVTNATPMTDYIEKNITVQGLWCNTSLLTNRVTSLAADGMMSFISRGANSYILLNSTQYPLTDGSVVEISLNKKHTAGKIFMAGAISECNLTDVSLWVDDTLIDTGPITGIRIQDFENFHSNLTLSAERSYTAWVSFEWEGVAIPVSWKRKLVIGDLMPTTERFMNLELSPSQTFFDGMAGTKYII